MANKQPYLRTVIHPIYAPSKGLVLNVPSPYIDTRATPDCQNVMFRDQTVSKRTGYPSTAYAAGTITGVPLKLYTFTITSPCTNLGVDIEMLATTTNLYGNGGGTWVSIADTLSNTVTSRVSMCTMHKDGGFYLGYTSKETGVYWWNAMTWEKLTEATTYKAKIMLNYQFRVLLFNVDEGGTDFPIKFRYCVANDIEDWNGTGSGSRNMVQGAGSSIMNAVAIKDYVGVYKDKSVSVLDYVGGSSIFYCCSHRWYRFTCTRCNS